MCGSTKQWPQNRIHAEDTNMNVIVVEPTFPYIKREFVRGRAESGATVVGIGERPKDWLDGQMKQWLFDYIQIRSVVDEEALEEAVKFVQGKMWVDRLEATVEAHIMPAAHVRERRGIPG